MSTGSDWMGTSSAGIPPSPPTFEAPPPSEPPPAQPAPQASQPSKSTGLKIACAVFALAAAAFAGLWLMERSSAADLHSKVDRYEAAAARDMAAADAIPDLMEVSKSIEGDDSDVFVSGDDESLDVEIPYPSDSAMDWVAGLLDELGFPPATVSRMEQTRALDGTLDAEGDHATATWTYHPDDGLSIVISVDD